MRLVDSFRLSVNSIMHRKLRAWLTLLGIVIGVAAVVAIVSIGQGATASVNARLSGFGADIITLSPGGGRGLLFGGAQRGIVFGSGGFRGGEGARPASSTAQEPVLTKNDVTVLKGNPNVAYVNEVVQGRSTLYFLTEQSGVQVQGVDSVTFTQTNNLTLASGRFLSPSDSYAAVVGDRVANQTFKQPITLGRKITLQNTVSGAETSFIVVGILQPSISGLGDNTLYIPYQSAWNVTDVNKDTFSSIQVKVKDKDLLDDTVAQLTTSLMTSRKVTERNQDFSITSSAAIKAQIDSVTQALTLFLGAIAAVSLIVGAVGIANSMFTSVLEKTREIGIMKALGATDNEVLKMFLIESGIFGFIGGLIGAGIGTVISSIIPLLGGGLSPGGGFTTLVTPELIIFAVGVSTLVGIVSGVMPARNAARLRPIEALRYE